MCSPNHDAHSTPTDDSHLQNATSSQQSSHESGVLNPPSTTRCGSLVCRDSDSASSTEETQVPEDRDDGHDSVPIEADVYMFVVNGRIDEILKMGVNLLKLKCKEDGNSVLHVAACAGQAQLTRDIIPLCKGIVKSKNWKDDTAFHCAARSAQLDVLLALTDRSLYDVDAGIINAVLSQKNEAGDTALHIALENNQEKMAEFLVNACPEACYVLNIDRISPIYMAVKLKNLQLVKQMMNFIKLLEPASVRYLMSGKSVVHAAIRTNRIDILKEILENRGELLNSFNDEFQTPLSYAAYKGHLDVVRYLLEKFPYLAYKCNKDGSFPIHSACSGGHVKVIKELHKTRYLINRQGQNILHVAAAYGKAEVVSYLLKIIELERLINLKDDDGNTPLHLATKGFHPRVVYILTRESRVKHELRNKDGVTALDIAEIHAESPASFEARLTWMALRYINSPRSSQSTRQNYFIKIGKTIDKTELEHYKKRSDTLMVVATLVATVTFAAGFTAPGAYKQDGPSIGMAVLVDKGAFQAFVICNAAALYTSILTVVSLIWAHMEDLKLILLSFKFALPLLGFSLTMMSLAFTMGLFVVLRGVPWLSYVVFGMGFVFVAVVLLVFVPLLSPSYIKNSVVRFLFAGPFLLLLLACEKRTVKYV